MSNKDFKNNRGSVWRKWDLHVHSPYVHLNKYTCSDQDFIGRILQEDLTAIGLTNYFKFSDEDFSLKEKLEKKGVKVFLNLEFRLDYQNKEDECLDLHIIFSDEATKGDIHKLLQNTTVNVNGTDKKCGDLNTVSDFKNAVINYDVLRKKLEEESLNLKDKYLIGFLSRGKGNARTSSNYEKITKTADLLIHSSDNPDNIEKDRKFWLGYGKPLLQNSDAHNLKNIGDKFSWIKADRTFNGLKQILWEPDERVKIQQRKPDDAKSKRVTIDKVSYTNSSRNQEIIVFSKDLNSIIGVRGSGKSTLLKNIAKTVDSKQFAEKDTKGPYSLDSFKVTWGDGQENEGTDESPKSLFYVPQNYLSALAYDDGSKVKERDVFLTTLLKKNTHFANAMQSFDSFVSKNRVKIEELIQKLLNADTLVRDTKVLLKKQGSKAEIDEEVKQKNVQIKKYKNTNKSGITDTEIKAYSQALEMVASNKKAVVILKQDKDILVSLKKAGADIFISDQSFSLLSSTRQNLLREELQQNSKETLEGLVTKEISKIEKQEKKLLAVIQKNEKVVKDLGEKVKKSKALSDLTTELVALKKVQCNINKLSKTLVISRKQCTDTVEDLAIAYTDFALQQKTVFQTVDFNESFSFLSVEIIAKYNTSQLRDFVERNINTRGSDKTLKNEEDIKALFGDNPSELSKETIKKMIYGLIDNRIKIKVEAEDVSTVISKLLRNRYEIDYLHSVKTQDGGTCFKDMTGGQKAIALLELIFRFDDEKYPILIDQPEDDLDVSGVATDLVNFIKLEKRDRQIVIVTHSASLTVCADTEEVITSRAQQIGSGKYDFSYATGAIENPKRRDDIIQVLEGGKDALKTRARKLDFKHEI